MRRTIGLCFGVMFLAACGEMMDSSPLGVPPDEGPGISATREIADATSEEPGPNSSFYWRQPIAESNPDAGPQDDNLEPIVTICSWGPGSTSCGDILATLRTTEPDAFGNQVTLTEGVQYSVVFKTSQYPVADGETFRILVSLPLPPGEELVLGWVDAKAYLNVPFSSYHFDPDGYLPVSTKGNVNINFTITFGAYDIQYCDPGADEDCDVRLFQPDEFGCLEVFENPGEANQLPGSQACVPENANPTLDGVPYTGVYAVILTLGNASTTSQGADFGPGFENPYFPDWSTDPHGITFSPTSGGVLFTICQQESAFESEDLLFQARPYLVYSDGTSSQTVVLKPSADGIPREGEYVFDPTACQDEQPIQSAAGFGSAPEGFLGRLASVVAGAKNLFRPTPLVARRIHGGLNTTIGGDAPPPPEDAVAAFAGEAGIPLQGGEVEIGAGTVLDVNIGYSEVAVDPVDGLMLQEATITVTPRNGRDEIIPFDVTVTVSVTGANSAELIAEDPDGDGIYEVTYTPLVAGTDYIQAFIDGVAFPEAFVYEVAPLSGVIEVYVEIDPSSIPASETNDPAVGLPVNLYDADGTFLEMTTTQATGTWGEGVAIFGSEEDGTYLFGDYTVSLPKRDFDFIFELDINGDEIYEQAVPHSGDPTVVTFSGALMDLGEGWHIYRIGAPLNGDAFGTGNVYRNVEDTRSWFSARNQIRDLTLPDAYEDVPAHLVTIKTAGENEYVSNLVKAQCSPETDAKKCKSQAWIGLSDEEIDGSFEWVNDEGYLNPCTPSDPRPSSPFFFGWEGREPSGRNNEDQVEINLDGQWFDENGASSTNDGYLIEFKAWQPQEDPPLMCPGG